MSDLLLYIGSTAVGCFAGSALRRRGKTLPWVGKAQTAVIMCLIVVMGIRLGANREVTAHLGEIGLAALLLTVLSLAFTVAGLFLARKLMGIDRWGRMHRAEETKTEEKETESGGGAGKMTLMIVAAILCGMVLGRLIPFFADWDDALSTAIRVGLCLLLFSIGLDLGLDGSGIRNIRAVGARLLVFPVVTAVSTILAGVLGSVLLGRGLWETVAIVCGFGWYTLTPGLIMDAGLIEASAIALIANILRETLSFVFVPVVARRIGYIEATGMPGAAAMDVCLPIVERSTSAEVAVYSFVSGAVLSLAVPFLVPVILSLV